MKTAGIIAEYNPLHSGHIYQMDETRRITGADYIVAVMSGSYTQRGIPAFFDKYIRTEMALKAGADLVLELPVAVSTGSGEYFAKGAVTLLHSLGVTDYLSFGSECGDINRLTEAASLLLNESDEFSLAVQKELCTGKTYPQAISIAAKNHKPELATLLTTPNNILGIEYLKALNVLNSSITPVTVKRKGNAYHDEELSNDKLPSATALRKYREENTFSDFLSHLPEQIRTVFTRNNSTEISNAGKKTDSESDSQLNDFGYLTEDDFSNILGSKLLGFSECQNNYADLNPDMTNRLCRLLKEKPVRFSELTEALKTRQITQARVQRALIHIMLGITAEDMKQIKNADTAPYIRVLGMKKTAAPLMKEIRQHAVSPIIARPAKDTQVLNDLACKSFKQDLNAYTLYRQVYYNKYPKSSYQPPMDYKGIILL
ncbi:MAG: nucleotidyltransferase family protein [Lachnospiraceae bacterium]